MNDHLADALDAVTTRCLAAEARVADIGVRLAEADDKIAIREGQCDELYNSAERWHKIADERSAEIIRLNARVADIEQALSNSVNADWHNKRIAELEEQIRQLKSQIGGEDETHY